MPMRSILHRVPGIAHKFLDRVACRFRSCGPLFPRAAYPGLGQSYFGQSLAEPARMAKLERLGTGHRPLSFGRSDRLASVAKQGIPYGEWELPRSEKRHFRTVAYKGDRGFESISLQRSFSCEPDFPLWSLARSVSAPSQLPEGPALNRLCSPQRRKVELASDSSLEGSGFQLSVPGQSKFVSPAAGGGRIRTCMGLFLSRGPSGLQRLSAAGSRIQTVGTA
jgi:hypothetical protein